MRQPHYGMCANVVNHVCSRPYYIQLVNRLDMTWSKLLHSLSEIFSTKLVIAVSLCVRYSQLPSHINFRIKDRG
jgi:hypothetical protein